MAGARRLREGAFTLVELMVVIAIIAVLITITVPNMLDARKYASEAAAVGDLRAIHAAEEIFRTRDLEADGLRDYGTLDELVDARLLTEGFRTRSHRGGYRFEAEASEFHYSVVARPTVPGTSGDKVYYLDETGVIRFTADGTRPDASSPPIGGRARDEAPP